MSAVTVRNIPESVHGALRARAARHGRSTEAEIRVILDAAVRPPTRVKLGSLLRAIADEAGGLTTEEIERFAQRNKTMAEAVQFE